ncbi:MAG: YfiR family protein, partial [Planctomycetales bacterium]
FLASPCPQHGGPALAFAQRNRLNVEKEYQVKVAYIFQFCVQFAWPSNAFANNQSPLVIGVYGNAPIGAKLNILAIKKKAQGRRILVKRIGPKDDPTQAQVLFVSSTTSPAARAALVRLTQNHPILLVGENRGFAEQGAAMNFFITPNATVGYEINIEACVRRHLNDGPVVRKNGRVVRDR